MPQITSVGIESRNRIVSRARGYEERAAYREAIANLSDDRVLELLPDAGESVRKLKLTVARAAKEVNRQVGYGESDTGTLLVWLEEAKRPRRCRRSRQAPASNDDVPAQEAGSDTDEE